MNKILFLASGRGSNFGAFVDHVRLGILQNASIACLISNHPGTGAVKIAKESGIPFYEIEGVSGKKFDSIEARKRAREKFDEECLSIARNQNADYLLLAGFDQILTPVLIDNFHLRILNIHPAYDTVRFGGRNMVGSKVHQSVIDQKEVYSGCTVQIVTSTVDEGPAIVKKRVDLLKEDTADSLAARILNLEHLAFPEALQLMIDGRVIISESEKQCFVDRYSGNWDVEWTRRQESYIKLASERPVQIV